jgi:hypothetical protein
MGFFMGRARQPQRLLWSCEKGVTHMDVRIKNGTPLHSESLCETCVHAHIVRGYRESEELTVCQATYPEHTVPFHVRECSGYTQMKRQTLKQMEDIAWVLGPNGGKRRAGFVPAADVETKETQVELFLRKKE